MTERDQTCNGCSGTCHTICWCLWCSRCDAVCLGQVLHITAVAVRAIRSAGACGVVVVTPSASDRFSTLCQLRERQQEEARQLQQLQQQQASRQLVDQMESRPSVRAALGAPRQTVVSALSRCAPPPAAQSAHLCDGAASLGGYQSSRMLPRSGLAGWGCYISKTFTYYGRMLIQPASVSYLGNIMRFGTLRTSYYQLIVHL